jgi:S-adenosylmethionine decarboxylase proenzyme
LATYEILVSGALLAAFVPLAQGRRLTWFDRLLERFRRSDVVAVPPVIENDAGWQLIHSEDADTFKDWLGKDSEGLPFGPGEAPSLGSHLLVELFGCDGDALKREDGVGEAMRSAAVESKATVVADSFHEFKPWGVSGAVIIQESHYTIHTWPEHGYAAVDLF